MEMPSGSLNAPAKLLYWIKERYKIYLRKENGFPKPWSDDHVFQTTYFCNVHRENDKVTKWIRGFTAPWVDHDLFEYNITLCRFLNWPPTLADIGFKQTHAPYSLCDRLELLAKHGHKVWGNAYVITTHGQKMAKATYLCHDVLEKLYQALPAVRTACRGGSCGVASAALRGIDGIGSFLAGQIVADLKNTPGHPLYTAEDKATFVEPGPGSIKGLSWFMTEKPTGFSPSHFPHGFSVVRRYVDENWPEVVPIVDNQDLQNCLCEFDKYMRVSTGSGRSKRGYNGA